MTVEPHIFTDQRVWGPAEISMASSPEGDRSLYVLTAAPAGKAVSARSRAAIIKRLIFILLTIYSFWEYLRLQPISDQMPLAR